MSMTDAEIVYSHASCFVIDQREELEPAFT
jgi:hypothetical protein